MIYPDIMVIFHQRPTNQPAWVQTFLPDGPSGSPLRCLLGSAAAPTRGWEQGGVRWGCNQQKGGSRDIILGYWAMGYIYIYHICNMYMYIYWIYIICVYNDSIYIFIHLYQTREYEEQSESSIIGVSAGSTVSPSSVTTSPIVRIPMKLRGLLTSNNIQQLHL